MKKLIYILFASTILLGMSCKKDKKIKGVKTVAIDGIPCVFDFNTLSANQEISVACNHDLGGATITLPVGVKIKYNGGSIVNGIFVFNNGKIAGELLNINLGLQGTGSLINVNSFEFVAEKWNVSRGVVSDVVALTNKENIKGAMDTVKFMQGKVFNINNFDGYFHVESPSFNSKTTSEYAILLPGNFHLKMGNNTHLRVQPCDGPAYALLSISEVDSVTISGGNVWGDRYTHTYATGTGFDTHEYDFCIQLRGAHHVVLHGVAMREATGDGFLTQAMRIRNADGTLQPYPINKTCEDILVKNCIIDKNRRNNISLVDGNGIIIENCIVTNAGDGGAYAPGEGRSSKGVLPRFGIDLEAYRSNGEWNKIHNVVIRNNYFIGDYNGDIDLFTCSYVEVYGNTFSKSVANIASHHINIYNNTFVSDGQGLNAINIGSYIIQVTGEELVTDYNIYNNTISGYSGAGIGIGGDNMHVHHNTINECGRGVDLGTGDNVTLNNNAITSSLTGAKGYNGFAGGFTLKNAIITNDTINLTGANNTYGILLRSTNLGLGNTGITFDGCYFKANFRGVDIRNSENITIKNTAHSNTSVFMTGGNANIILTNNTIIP